MPDLPFYKPHQLADLRVGYRTVNPAYKRLMFGYLSLRLTNEAAQEYARHGFVRRLGTLKRCIENVYSTRVARERKGKLGGRKPVPEPVKDRARKLRNEV